MKIPARNWVLVLVAALACGVHTAAFACTQRQPTPTTFPGPHDFSTAPTDPRLWREGDGGEPLFLQGRVLDTCGEAVAGARVRILHADQNGEHDPNRWRVHLDSDERGAFEIVTVLPGHTGTFARHMHFVITHPAHQDLVTRLYFTVDPAVDPAVDDLTIVLEEVRRGDDTGWIAGYEFVLTPK